MKEFEGIYFLTFLARASIHFTAVTEANFYLEVNTKTQQETRHVELSVNDKRLNHLSKER